MKKLLSIIFIILAITIVGAKNIIIKNSKSSLKATPDGVFLCDSKGNNLVLFSALWLCWNPAQMKCFKTVKINENTIRADYKTIKDKTGQVKLYSLFSLKNDILDIEFYLNAPEGVNVNGSMYGRYTLKSKIKKMFKLGTWTRHKYSGVPFEKKALVLRKFEGKNALAWENINGNPVWSGTKSQHLRFKKEKKTGLYHCRIKYLVTGKNVLPAMAGAMLKKRSLAVEISTQKACNFFSSLTQKVDGEFVVCNPRQNTLENVNVNIWARDYYNNTVFRKKLRINLKPLEAKRIPILLPAGMQNFYVVEGSARQNGKEYFARMSVAVVKPYEYRFPEKSMFGISAYFNEPSRQSILDFMTRIGIRWIRNGDNKKLPAKNKFVAISHKQIPRNWTSFSKRKKQKFLKKLLLECKLQENEYCELGNELDFVKNQNKANAVTARIYVEEILKPLAELKKTMSSNLKIISIGFSNGFHGAQSVRMVLKNGGGDYLAGIAYHLGRGNVTPDYVGNGSWLFLRDLKRLNKVLDKYGQKDVWITEAYACTAPNSWWHDSERRAAENVILSFATAAAEKVKVVFWYQLHDSVWFDIGGVNSKSSEYYYGLLDRRGNVKASAVAYQTVSKALDGATCKGYLKFNDKNLKGIGFTTPQGKMVILWDRTEGYRQSNKSNNYAANEVWIDHWKNKKKVKFKSSKKVVKVLNVIGQEKNVPVINGLVELELTGAPVIVYGLDI